jgi:hypothetical protein
VGYILALPYFIFVTYLLAGSIKDKGLGGGIFSSGVSVFVYTLPWSLLIDLLNNHMEAYKNYTSFSLEHPLIYISILGILYFIAIVLNTAILFLAGKGFNKLVQIIFHT